VDATLPGDPAASEPYDVAGGNGLLEEAVLAAGLGVIGTAAAATVVRRARRPSPPDTVAQLDALGIDARVEHSDLLGLHEALAAGSDVLLATDGTAGTSADLVVRVEALDEPGERLRLVDSKGRRRAVALWRFEEAWADTANQVITARGDAGSVVLLPVVLRDDDLSEPS
jgi:hypothetical protein